MEDLRHHVRQSLFWNAIQQWGAQGIRLVVILVLARLVKPEEFGAYALVSTIIGLAQLLCGQGMTAAITQRDEFEERHLGAAFIALVGGGLALAGILYAAAPWLAHALSLPVLTGALRATSIVLPLNGFSGVSLSVWRRRLDFRRIATVTTLSQLIASVVGIVLACYGFGIWSLVTRQVCEAVLLVPFVLTGIPWRSLLQASRKSYLEMLRFGAPIAASNLLALGRNRLDELLIGSWLGVEQLGYYALARRQMDGIAFLFPTVVGNALMPILARVQRDSARVQAVMMRGIGILGAFAIPAFAGIGASAGIWVPLLLGARWQPSIPVIGAFAVVAACHAIASFSLGAMIATGHPGKRLGIEVVTSSASFLVIVAAAPFGLRMVAYASAAAAMVITALELVWISRWIPVRLSQQVASLRSSLASAVLLSAVCLLLTKAQQVSPWLRLGAAMLAVAIVLFAGYRRLPAMTEPAKEAVIP